MILHLTNKTHKFSLLITRLNSGVYVKILRKLNCFRKRNEKCILSFKKVKN